MNKADSLTSSPKLTVYYDGQCPLCRAEIHHYASRKGADEICFLDASHPENDLGDNLDRDSALGRFHVRKEDGSLMSGAAGFVAIWSALPGWRWLARAARIPGMTPLLELLYRGFLPIRPTLSRLFSSMTQGKQRS